MHFLRFRAFTNAGRFRVVPVGLLHVLVFKGCFGVDAPRHFKDEGFEIANGHLVPVGVSRVVFEILRGRVGEGVVRCDVRRVVRFARFVAVLSGVYCVLYGRPGRFLTLVLGRGNQGLVGAGFYFSRANVFNAVDGVASIVTGLLGAFVGLFFDVRKGERVVSFLYSWFPFRSVFLGGLPINMSWNSIDQCDRGAVASPVRCPFGCFRVLLYNGSFAGVATRCRRVFFVWKRGAVFVVVGHPIRVRFVVNYEAPAYQGGLLGVVVCVIVDLFEGRVLRARPLGVIIKCARVVYFLVERRLCPRFLVVRGNRRVQRKVWCSCHVFLLRAGTVGIFFEEEWFFFRRPILLFRQFGFLLWCFGLIFAVRLF